MICQLMMMFECSTVGLHKQIPIVFAKFTQHIFANFAFTYFEFVINVTLNRAILLEIYLHCPDNVPVPIFVHLLHGYSQNCYLVGIEFPLNLNLEFLVQAGE